MIVYSRNGKRVLSYSKDDPVGQSYCSTTNDISSGVAGAETNQVLVRNTSSNQIMRISKLITSTCVSTNNNIFRFYKHPTWSLVGTVLDSINTVFSSATPSTCTITSGPTIISKGTRLMTYCVGATSTVDISLPNSIILAPGESLLITVRPNTSGVTSSITLFWTEEPT